MSSGPLVRPNRNRDSHKNGEKSGQIGTFYEFSSTGSQKNDKIGTLYLGRKSKIGTKSGQFTQMSRIRDSVPKIGTTKGPALHVRVIFSLAGPIVKESSQTIPPNPDLDINK